MHVLQRQGATPQVAQDKKNCDSSDLSLNTIFLSIIDKFDLISQSLFL